MHRHVEWMVPADAAILQFLYSSRTPRGDLSIQTPNTVAINTGYSNRHTSARLLVLARYGLVDRVDDGRYRLTDLGVDALDNEISLEELDDLEPEDLDVDDQE